MLFDLGGGNDTYTSLRMSQGYAHLGVGVLYDDGGADRYRAEAAAQGSAQFGIGIAIDAGTGNDVRESFVYSQGFAYVGAVGLLYDGGGNDVYIANNGNPNQGGRPLYFSPQLPGKANPNMSQGAALGIRNPEKKVWWSGGLGVLRDVSGNDRYEAGIFAQGAGYWQGTGILSDGSGNDRYDPFWYAQGSAAHFAVGILADYLSLTALTSGTANTTKRCAEKRATAETIGIMIDAGGRDNYVYPKSKRCSKPSDGGTWGCRFDGFEPEHAAGIDREGDTGVHVQSR